MSPLPPNPPKDPANPQDAYSDLAPDPVGPAVDATAKRDWLAEFPDEVNAARKPRPASWAALSESLKKEKP